jgi:hypothetical protein
VVRVAFGGQNGRNRKQAVRVKTACGGGKKRAARNHRG